MTPHFSPNPIIALEWRARWRDARSFRLLFLCVALLGVVAFFSYYSAVETFNYNGDRSSLESSAHAGAGLFLGLSIAQTLGWMLLAPLMTATTIAAEREQGILEGVQLSHLKPLQIVGGKLLSALIFALLLAATTLPIVGICFLLGGVSPAEFMQSLVLQFSTAVCGASAGLFFSAHSRRAGAALRGALISVIAWCIGSYILVIIGMSALSVGTKLSAAERIAAQLAVLQGFLNPAMVVSDSLLNRLGGGGGFLTGAAGSGSNVFSQLLADIMTQPPWIICVVMQTCAMLLFLVLAARAVRRPLGEFDETAARRKAQRRIKTGAAPTSASTRKASNGAAASGISAPNTPASTRSAPHDAKSGAAWWEVPYFSRLTFQNPMLQREVRGKFRMRRVSLVVLLIEGALALGVAYLYLRTMVWALTDADARTTVWWVLAWTGLILLLIATPVMGAAAFTRERETGTFEGVMLSLLSDRDITRGKLLAPLFACAVYGVLPLLPLLLLCIRPQAYASYNSQPDTWLYGITIWEAMATFCVLGAAAYAGTSLGMAASWTARRTSEAVGRSLGLMFVWLAVLQAMIISIFGLLANSDTFGLQMIGTGELVAETLSIFGSPLLALASLSGSVTLHFGSVTPLVIAFLSVCGSFLVATLARLYLTRAMRKRALEHERKR